MKKYVLLSMVVTALVGCGGVGELPGLEEQEEVATLPDGNLATLEDVAGEDIPPVIQEDETGRVTATGANCHVDLQWCTSPTTGTYQCVNNGQCTFSQAVSYCLSLVRRFC
ncbi:hypothetical protein [Corallococcus carmarthensis]|uniref:Lipoprotein n=1 Tax=Corallococcus carmarthensis TaxID=2316728 RepID=A0A3A8JHV3_9BACT|nr:hypothetical protein [Corallococcus carmarthensis]NOK23197.1 hypothetical protein [Corallococcus carmarthensis]RKG94548.1 hypothetical protein D7X32_41860 [Corallococcus carmarthensis]